MTDRSGSGSTAVRWTLRTATATGWTENHVMSDVSTSDPESHLAALLEQRALVIAAMDAEINQTVDAMRTAGASWADVARVCGVSRQAARQRWNVVSVGS